MSLQYKFEQVENKIRISPSSFYSLMKSPDSWYNKTVNGGKFDQNEETIIGTLIHNRIEKYYLNEPIDHVEEQNYIQSYRDIAVNEWRINSVVSSTYDEVKKFLDVRPERPETMEIYLQYEPKTNDKVYLGGTYDYQYSSVVGDIKTTSKLPSEIKEYHRLQLYTYAWLLQLNGTNIDTIEVMYIQKHQEGKLSEKTGKLIGVKQAEVLILKEPIDTELFNEWKEYIIILAEKLKDCLEDETLIPKMFPKNYITKAFG